MRYRTSCLVLLVASFSLVALPACDSGGDEGDDDPSIEGSFSGSGSVDGTPATLTLNLNEGDGGQVSGFATLEGQGASFDGDVTGTYAYPDIRLDIDTPSAEVEDLDFRGEVSSDGDRLEGTLSGEEFSGVDFTFTRD